VKSKYAVKLLRISVWIYSKTGCCNFFLSNNSDNQVTGKAQGKACMNAVTSMKGAFKTGFHWTPTKHLLITNTDCYR